MSYDPCALLAELVRIPSPSGSEARVRDHLWSFFQERGLDVERVGDSLLVTIERGPGPTLLLNSHMDTVPAGPSWTADPYAGIWQDGKLVGLGANDAGAAVVGMIGGALAFAKESGATGTLQRRGSTDASLQSSPLSRRRIGDRSSKVRTHTGT